MRPRRRLVVAIGGLALVAVMASGCGGVTPTAASLPASPMPTVGSSTPPPVTPGPADPPVATIGVEGGDPVRGQLGTYAWAGGGSSSPWLPGAPIAVGAGETLTVRLMPAVVVTEWTAHIAPAGGDGNRAVVLTSGTGQPVMDAPRAGSWTVAVTVEFGALGSATYAWRVDVS